MESGEGQQRKRRVTVTISGVSLLGVAGTVLAVLVGQGWFTVVDDRPYVGPAAVDRKIIEPVREYFAARVTAAYATGDAEKRTAAASAKEWLTRDAQAALERRLARDSRSASQGEQSDLVTAWLGDALLWTNMTPLPGPEPSPPVPLEVTGIKTAQALYEKPLKIESATVTPTRPAAFRRVWGGCQVLDGSYRVVAGPHHWLIDSLPDTRRCERASPKLARQSVAWVPPREIAAVQRLPVTATVDGQAADAVLGRTIVNGTPTAWRAGWQRGGLTIRFTFPAPVAVNKVQFFNGGEASRFVRNGRAAFVTLSAQRTTANVLLPDRRELLELTCDLGVTRSVDLRIASIYPPFGPPADDVPAASVRKALDVESILPQGATVALREVRFYGHPARPTGGARVSYAVAPRPRWVDASSSYAAACAEPATEVVRPVAGLDGFRLGMTQAQWSDVDAMPAAAATSTPTAAATPTVAPAPTATVVPASTPG